MICGYKKNNLKKKEIMNMKKHITMFFELLSFISNVYFEADLVRHETFMPNQGKISVWVWKFLLDSVCSKV